MTAPTELEAKMIEQIKLLKSKLKETDALVDSLNQTVQAMQAEISALKKKQPNGRFTPPTIEEAEVELASKGYPGLGEEFVAHYARQGWKLGNGVPCTNWKACAVTWVKNQKKGTAPVAPDRKPADIRASAMEERATRIIEERKQREREAVSYMAVKRN